MSGRRVDQEGRPRVSGWVRAVPIMAAFIVGAASFTLSFFAQSEVSAALGAVPDHLSWLVPIIIDGGILAGSASVWASSTRGARKDPIAYMTIVGLLALSVIINVHHAAASGGVLGSVIAGAPPVVLLLCLELVAAQARREAIVAAANTAADEAHAPQPVHTPAPQSAPTPRPTTQPTRTPPVTPLPSLSERPGAAPMRPRPLEPATTPASTLALAPAPAPAPIAVRAPAPSSVTAPAAAARPLPTPTTPASTEQTYPRPAAAPAPAPAPTPAPATRPTTAPAVPARTAALDAPRAAASVKVTQPAAPAPLATAPAKSSSQADQIRAQFAAHVAGGGDPMDPTIARSIAETLNAPIPSVRKIVAQERKANETVSA